MFYLAFLAVLIITTAAAIGIRSPVLRFAALTGWLGPLPGCFFYAWHFERRELSHPLSLLASAVVSPFAAMVFAIPMFGAYCFAAGLLGGGIVMMSGSPIVLKLDRTSKSVLLKVALPDWVQPAAIVAWAVLAAIPLVLMGFAGEAITSAIFWAIVCLTWRRILFPRSATVGAGASAGPSAAAR